MDDDGRIKTCNPAWGYHGTLRAQGHGDEATAALFDVMARRLMSFGMTDEQARRALDARWGRHLADWIGDDFAAVIDDETEETLRDADTEGLFQAVEQGEADEKILRHWRTGLRRMAGFWVRPVLVEE